MHVLTSPHLWRRTSLSSMRRPDDPVRKKLTKRPASPLVGGRLFWPAGCHEVPDCASLIGLNADRNCKNRAVFLVALECSVVILQHLNRFGSLGGLVLFTLDEIDTADSGMSCVGIPFPSAVIPPSTFAFALPLCSKDSCRCCRCLFHGVPFRDLPSVISQEISWSRRTFALLSSPSHCGLFFKT